MSTQLSLLPETNEEKFWDFHTRHPEVYGELRRRAFEAKRYLEERGRRPRIGIRLLWERMRWTFYFERDGGEEYKLNDHYPPFYSRLLMEREPELVGFFETRGD